MSGFSLGLSRFSRALLSSTAAPPSAVSITVDSTGKVWIGTGFKPASTIILYSNGTPAAPAAATEVARNTSDGSGKVVWTLANALTPGLSMSYDGAVVGSAGVSPTPQAPAPAVPAAPSIALTASAGQVSVAWIDGSDNGAAITGHNLYRGTVSGTRTLVGTISTGSPYVDTGLTNGTTYYYSISAVNLIGEGVQSAEASAKPASVVTAKPLAPSVLAISGNGQATLRITDDPASQQVLRWNIYSSTASGGAFTYVGPCYNAADFRTFLSNGSTAFYKVTSLNAMGEGPYSAEVTATAAATNGNPLRIQNVLFFTNTLFYSVVCNDYRSGSSLSVTANDSTVLTVKSSGGALVVYGTFTSTGSKTLTFTETTSGGTVLPSTTQVVQVVARPVASLSDLKATASALKARMNAKPSYIDSNSFVITDNGTTKPTGFTYTSTIPYAGRSAPPAAYYSVGGFGPTQYGVAGYDPITQSVTTNISVPFSNSSNNGMLRFRLFKRTWVLPMAAVPGVVNHAIVRYSDDNGATFNEAPDPIYTRPTSKFFTIDPGSNPPAGGRIWEVEFSSFSNFNNFSYAPGFGFESGETVQAVADTSPVALGEPDSFMNGSGALNQAKNLFKSACRGIGLVNAWNAGIPAHRYSLPAGAGFPLASARIGGNVYGLGDVQVPPALDVFFMNYTINDGGQGDMAQYQACITNTMLLFRYYRPKGLLILTFGIWAPNDYPGTALYNALTAAFNDAKDAGMYYNDGRAAGWQVPAGGTGSSPYFLSQNNPQMTAGVTGTTLTVTAAPTGGLEPGQTLCNGNTNLLSRIYKQIDGTPGGVGNYKLDIAPNSGDIAAGTALQCFSEGPGSTVPVHPNPAGHLWAGARIADGGATLVNTLMAA